MLDGRVLPNRVLLWAWPGHAGVASIALGTVCCTLAAHARAVLIATVEAIAVVAVIVLRSAGIASGSMLHSTITANHSVIAIVAAVGGCTCVWILHSAIAAD